MNSPAGRWAGTINELLPADADNAVLVGRVWDPRTGSPLVVRVTSNYVLAPEDQDRWATMADLTEELDPAGSVRTTEMIRVAATSDVLANTVVQDRPDLPRFLSPIDLHCVKASGVTFVASLLERVVEETVRGSAGNADTTRASLTDVVGNLAGLKGGSPDALKLLADLTKRGFWSQYLEVGLGADAEIFTKCPVLASVGTGSPIGVLERATWTNSEPEAVLVIRSDGVIIGATLGNDMNLRDMEGRSALLLGRAKDNTSSAAVGPFLRLFDHGFDLDDLMSSSITMTIRGEDGYELQESCDLRQISRSPHDLVGQLMGRHHQYPDGVVLYLGTPFAPTDDRDEPGLGFSHKTGDVVAVSSPWLGTLTNRVRPAEDCPPWEFGLRSLLSIHRRTAVEETS